MSVPQTMPRLALRTFSLSVLEKCCHLAMCPLEVKDLQLTAKHEASLTQDTRLLCAAQPSCFHHRKGSGTHCVPRQLEAPSH